MQSFPVRHQGEMLGAIGVHKPPSDPLTPADEKLVVDLAAQAGLVLRNVRLIEELRASRQRIVAAQDEERRKIERNLHDGAQQHLVALTVALRLTRELAESDPEQTRSMLDQMGDDLAEAVQQVRDLAHGIYPPLLADKGLPDALAAAARRASLPTEVQAEVLRRYPAVVRLPQGLRPVDCAATGDVHPGAPPGRHGPSLRRAARQAPGPSKSG